VLDVQNDAGRALQQVDPERLLGLHPDEDLLCALEQGPEDDLADRAAGDGVDRAGAVVGHRTGLGRQEHALHIEDQERVAVQVDRFAGAVARRRVDVLGAPARVSVADEVQDQSVVPVVHAEPQVGRAEQGAGGRG